MHQHTDQVCVEKTQFGLDKQTSQDKDGVNQTWLPMLLAQLWGRIGLEVRPHL